MTGNRQAGMNLLGPPSNKINKGPDLSVLKPPILTSLTGMKQAIHALETGSTEVRSVLFNEANVIYECRVCLSMFRSLCNLVAHKRSYCRVKSDAVTHKFEADEDKENATTVLVQPEDTDCYSSVNTWNMENYSPSMELIQSTGILQDILSEPTVKKLNRSKSINAVTRRLNAIATNDPRSLMRSKVSRKVLSQPPGTVILEPMFNTSNAIYQTWRVSGEPEGETMKDIQSENNQKIVVDKHVVVINGTDGATASETNSREAQTDKSSEHPPKTMEPLKTTEPPKATEQQSLRYPCPFCSTHVKEWRYLRRHMINVHGKDPDYVNANKEKFMMKAFYMKSEEDPTEEEVKPSAENQIKPCLPVKPVQVDLKKLNADMSGLCKLIQNSKECPVLKNRVPLITSEPIPMNTNYSSPQSEDTIPLNVERKIMEHIDRRRLQCNVCFKKFRRTYLAQQHVAGAHLKLHRFKCRVCGFGAWMRDHVTSHAEKSHRKLTSDTVEEQPEEVYFQEHTQKTVIKEPQGLILQHNLENFVPYQGSSCSKSNSYTASHVNGIAEADDKIEDDMVPVSLIAGIKSQFRHSMEERDSDEEISFKNGSKSKRKRLSSPDADGPKKEKKGVKSQNVREESPGLLSKMMMSLPEMLSPSKSKLSTSKQEIGSESFRTPRSGGEKETGLSAERSGRSTRQRSITPKLCN